MIVKTEIEVNYLGHNIKVTNKWSEMSLIVDDTFRGVFAVTFILTAFFEHEKRIVLILLKLKLKWFGGTLLLSANKQSLAQKRMIF